MKKAFVFSLLATLAITGCQREKEIFTEEPTPSKVFTAIVEDEFSGDSKTSMDGSRNVCWKLGDQVSVFVGSTVNDQYQVSDESDGQTTATLNKISDGEGTGTAINNNVAFYPYASSAEVATNEGSYVISGIELPATQTYAAGSFGNGAYPMTAVTSGTEDTDLKFKNVLGGLKLQLKGTATITSITVRGNNDEILCGDAEVTVAYNGLPSIALSTASAKTVTLNCGAGVTLNSETETPFIIALPPMTMTGGFTVVVRDSEDKEMEIKSTKSQTITRSKLLKMPAKDYVAGPSYLKFTSTGETSIALTQSGSPAAIALEYKVGNGAWASYTIGNAIGLTDGQEVSFRAGSSGNTSFNNYRFTVTGSGTVAASGDIRSLLKKEVETANLTEFCFCKLFYECSKLTSAPSLPATTLASNCYYGMFQNCTSLTSAPELPATTLAPDCYAGMFSNCTSLTTAPALPATTLATSCYQAMFSRCTSLTTAPVLPATTLAGDCYLSMFRGCTGLKSAPALPATTLAGRCYQGMFYGCTGLKSAPVLPATTLADDCYQSMFYGCTGLPSAPALPATTLAGRCYQSMFYGCTGLKSAPALPATTLARGCYASMFRGCTGLTSAPALPATTLASNCYYGMFQNCTSLTSAPELPATTLADGCYDSMFYGCTGLTSAPALPATTLAPKCYYYMFCGCTNLNYIKCLATDDITYIRDNACTSNWVKGVSSTGTFVCPYSMFDVWLLGSDGVPSGWTPVQTE